MMASVGLTFTLVGCDSKPAETEQAAAKPAHVSENDQYLQRMQQEVKIDDPDSLIEDVNETVGNDDNAEKAKQLAAQGVTAKTGAAPAATAPAAPADPAMSDASAPAAAQ
mgnify:FL=1